MVIRTTLGSTPVSVSINDHALTIGVGDNRVLAWDLGGRLYSVFDVGRTYRRGLNGGVLAKWRERGIRQRSWLPDVEAAELLDRSAQLAADLLDARSIAGPGVASPRSAGVELHEALTRAAAFDARAAMADAAAFGEVYRPIGILPPDQYLALVLQATEGCSFGTCTFCRFYRDPYRVRDASAFAAHVSAVCEFLGDSLALRARRIFLGSANALAVPMSGLMPIFDVLVARFPDRPVNAFLDGFTGSLKTASDYRALGARGLRRVYVGLESGHDPLLEFVHKPATSRQAIDTVRAIKSGGVAVAVIVMIGLGGSRFAAGHVNDTIDALRQMSLDAGDLVYFSDLVDLPGSSYPEAAHRADIDPLTPSERANQRDAIEASFAGGRSRPRLATYDVREFVY